MDQLAITLTTAQGTGHAMANFILILLPRTEDFKLTNIFKFWSWKWVALRIKNKVEPLNINVN